MGVLTDFGASIFGLVYRQPQFRDIESGIDIRIEGETALDTHEFGLGLPVLPVDASATGTGAGRISWIDNNQGNAVHQGLVGKELAKLKERPGMVSSSLGFPDNHRVSDVCQILDGDSFSLRSGFFQQCAWKWCDS